MGGEGASVWFTATGAKKRGEVQRRTGSRGGWRICHQLLGAAETAVPCRGKKEVHRCSVGVAGAGVA